MYITSVFLIFFSDVACGLRVKLRLHLHSVIFSSASDCMVLCIAETGRYLLYLFHAQKAISHYSLLTHLTVDIVRSMCLILLTDVKLLQPRTTALCCNPSFLRLLKYYFAMNKLFIFKLRITNVIKHPVLSTVPTIIECFVFPNIS